MIASRDKQPVVARIDRTQEIIQAVEGWKCASRSERIAFWRSESACKRETIIDGQYASASDTIDSLADCRCPFPLGVVRFGDDGLDQLPDDFCPLWGDCTKRDYLKVYAETSQRKTQRLTSDPGNTSSVREAATAVVAT